jgi:hypothetical protein
LRHDGGGSGEGDSNSSGSGGGSVDQSVVLLEGV